MLTSSDPSGGAELHPTRLTPDEQYSHVSLFCLLSAPLLIGCPIEQLDGGRHASGSDHRLGPFGHFGGFGI